MQRVRISWEEYTHISGLFEKDWNYIFIWKAKLNETFSADSHLLAAPSVQIGLWQIFRFSQKG